jgi:hypothetical protein
MLGGACALACEAPTLNSSMATASPASSAIYCNVSKHGTQLDNYQLARNNRITCAWTN